MKKIAIIAGLFCFALNAVAAVTPTGKLNITISSANQENKVLRLRQHTSFSDAFDNGWDAEAVAAGGIYVLSAGTHYTTWASNQFSNLPVGFGAIEDNNYTLTFSNFGGEDIKFTDLVTGDEFTLSSSTTYPYVYNFTITDAEKNTAINDRFMINKVTPAVKAICFNYNKLELTKYAGATVEVFADGAATASVTENIAADATTEIDLNALASGKYKVVISGIATPEEYIIDVKPAVTVVP